MRILICFIFDLFNSEGIELQSWCFMQINKMKFVDFAAQYLQNQTDQK